MLAQTPTLPDDPAELRSFTARLLAEVKAQAILIEKLRHQLAGYRAHRFGASSETAEQLQLALETSEIAAAVMTARMRLPDIKEKDKPRRRPNPAHVPGMEVELSPAADACADCGGRLRRIGQDVTDELEYVPGRSIVKPRGEAPRRRHPHFPKRRGHHPPRRRTDARDQRQMGRRAALHEP